MNHRLTLVSLLALAGATWLIVDHRESPIASSIEPQPPSIESRAAFAETELHNITKQPGAPRSIAQHIDSVQRQLNPEWGSGHPEYGHFGSLPKLEQHVANLARFGLNADKFVRTCLRWGAGDGRSDDPIPEIINPEGKELSTLQAHQVQQEIEVYNRIVEDAARSAWSFLEYNTDLYSRSSLERVPSTADLEGPVDDRSHFHAYTHVVAGNWKYVVDFRSSEYPELESTLAMVRQVKRERLDRVRNLIASF